MRQDGDVDVFTRRWDTKNIARFADEDWAWVSVTPKDFYRNGEYGVTGELIIQLPHQCDEWIIGTANEAQALVEAIDAAILYIRNPNNYRIEIE